MPHKKETEYKIVICGAGGVGKTTLIQTFKKGHFVSDVKMNTAPEYAVIHLANQIGHSFFLFLESKIGEGLVLTAASFFSIINVKSSKNPIAISLCYEKIYWLTFCSYI